MRVATRRSDDDDDESWQWHRDWTSGTLGNPSLPVAYDDDNGGGGDNCYRCRFVGNRALFC